MSFVDGSANNCLNANLIDWKEYPIFASAYLWQYTNLHTESYDVQETILSPETDSG